MPDAAAKPGDSPRCETPMRSGGDAMRELCFLRGPRLTGGAPLAHSNTTIEFSHALGLRPGDTVTRPTDNTAL